MNYKTPILAAACLTLGLAIGLVASDVATYQGFPHETYIVELTHEQTPRSDFRCMWLGTQFGKNLSMQDKKTGAQQDCVLFLTGTRNKDGSFDACNGWESWYFRLANRSHLYKIPAAEIKSMKRVDFLAQLFS